MTSAAAQLFRDFVWEPLSLSGKASTSLPGHHHGGALKTDFISAPPCVGASVQQLNRTIRRRLVDRNRFKDDHHDTCMFIERSKNLNVVAYQANLVDAKTGGPVASGAKTTDCAFKANDPLHAYWIKIEPEHVARRRARGEMEDICELNMLERKLAYGCSATVLTKDKFVNEVLPDKARRAAATAEEKEAIALLHDELQPCLCKFVAMSSWHVWMVRLLPLTDVAASAGAVAALDTDDEGSPASLRRTHSNETEGSDGNGAGAAFPMNDTVVAMLALIGGELSVVQKVYVSSVEPKHFYQLPKVEYIEVHGTSLATGKATYEKRTS